jgi:hypothetical protein
MPWYVFLSRRKEERHRLKFERSENRDRSGDSNRPDEVFAIFFPNPFSNVGGRRLAVPICSAVQSLSLHKGHWPIGPRQITTCQLANFATLKSCLVKIAMIIHFSGRIR